MKCRAFLGALSVLLATSSVAMGADIVDVRDVRAALERGAILWDVRGATEYAKGHIPGAVNIGHAADVLRNPNTEDYLPLARVQALLGAGGIDVSKTVVTYGRRGDPVAYWGLTTVSHVGGQRGRVFHGGLDAWRAAGLPLAKKATRLPAVKQSLRVDPTVHVYLPEVLSRVGDPSVQFVDTREPAEFRGDVIKALRGSHIPGAINIPFERNWIDPTALARLETGDAKAWDGMALNPLEQLKTLYADLDPTKETIVYCQSGVRASETAWALRSMGFDKVRVFEQSWLGDGNDISAPAEGGPLVNVGAMRARIERLEQALETLAREVEALEAVAPKVAPAER